MDLVGQYLGRYQVLEKVGSGGMADVYKGYQASLDRYVAIKVLPVSLGRDERFRARFDQEAVAVAQLHHSNILTVFDYGRQDDLAYIVMEYAPGGTLKERLRRPLTLREAMDLICQVGEALAYAHRRGVIHRDVKPSNVMLGEEGRPLLSDFGLAKMVQDRRGLTLSGVSIGTPEYMSPEQGQGLKVDHRSDIYSLGVMLYEVVTGEVPYKAEIPMAIILKHMTAPIPSPRDRCPGLPTSVEAVIVKAMAKDPAGRYESAQEMVAALRRAMDEVGADQVVSGPSDTEILTETAAAPAAETEWTPLPTRLPDPDTQPDRARPSGRRFPWWIVWLVLFLILGGAAVSWFLVPGLPDMVLSWFPVASPTATPAPTRTLVATPTFTLLPTRTGKPQPTQTQTQTPTFTPVPTVMPTPTSAPTPTATPEPTLTPSPSPSPTITRTPTEAPTATPTLWVGSTAKAIRSASVMPSPMYVPDAQLDYVPQDGEATVLGRADIDQYGRWFYLRTAQEIEGFAYAPYFDWAGDFEALPVIEPGEPTTPIVPTRRASGPLVIERVWWSSYCSAGGWTAVFDVKVSGGNGSYTFYWGNTQVQAQQKQDESNAFVFTVPGTGGLIVDTVWVVSGDQRVGQEASAQVPAGGCN